MPAIAPALAPAQLRLTIDPASLGFGSTAELCNQPLPWIGQERAHAAAQFGLAMQQPDYHLFVLGEVGCGRSSLMRQAMHAAASSRPVPPDLCYLHNFEAPHRPLALRLPSGLGHRLQSGMARLVKSLPIEISKRLANADVKAEEAGIEKAWQAQEDTHFAALEAFAQTQQLRIAREGGQMVLTLTGPKGQPLTENEVRALPAARRAEIDAAERALRTEIARFLEATRPLERARDDALATLQRQAIAPLVEQALHAVQQSLLWPTPDTAPAQDPSPAHPEAYPHARLLQWHAQVQRSVLAHMALFVPCTIETGGGPESDAQADHKDRLDDLLARYQVNVVVDNSAHTHAPVVVEDHPTARTLFGTMEHGSPDDAVQAAHASVQAGSLLKAHGGFLLLQLHDIASEEGLWPRLRRFLRCGKLYMEDTGSAASGPGSAVALQPEPVEVDVKLVVIGSVDEYYALQEADPDAARRFRAKVDFAERFAATPGTHHATAVFMAHSCHKRGLPHCTPDAVALLLEHTHREADDQHRQSALFSHTEALLMESAALCTARGAPLVQACDVLMALEAQRFRHNEPEQQLHETIAEGERLISAQGTVVGQINAMTQIDLGDYRFGFPVRITARTFAGQEGLLNIEREVDMSGPIHDKGVLILHSYLTALFTHVAPLALNASIVFEQEYSGVEGDSASCAELYALLSSLSGLPLRQGIAVTGALNQHGEVLPVGGINEKIEGWFQVCAAAGLDGTQGVLIPARNQRHLMLDRRIAQAVERGLFSVHTMEHVSEGIALLTGEVSGMSPAELLQAQAIGMTDPVTQVQRTVLQRAESTLRAYRRACQSAGHTRRGRGGLQRGM